MGLENPLSGAELVDTLTVENAAVASSAGSATRFDEQGRHHHLFDPRTGTSANRYLGVTVVAPNATTADALSTGFASMEHERVKEVLLRLPTVTARMTSRSGEILTWTGSRPEA